MTDARFSPSAVLLARIGAALVLFDLVVLPIFEFARWSWAMRFGGVDGGIALPVVALVIAIVAGALGVIGWRRGGRGALLASIVTGAATALVLPLLVGIVLAGVGRF